MIFLKAMDDFKEGDERKLTEFNLKSGLFASITKNSEGFKIKEKRIYDLEKQGIIKLVVLFVFCQPLSHL